MYIAKTKKTPGDQPSHKLSHDKLVHQEAKIMISKSIEVLEPPLCHILNENLWSEASDTLVTKPKKRENRTEYPLAQAEKLTRLVEYFENDQQQSSRAHKIFSVFNSLMYQH